MPASRSESRRPTPAEKRAALVTEECLETRARRVDRAACESVLAREPEPDDRL